jgi:drug/metabolite transporter (DMT)-like permease
VARTTGHPEVITGPGAGSPTLGRRGPAVLALVGATAVWGSTFVVTKESLGGMAPAAFLAWRFGLAAVVLLAARPRAVAGLGRTGGGPATTLGTAVAAGFLLQTTGLQHTLAGVSGFLTGASVVLTPVVAAVAFRARVGAAGWVAVALAAVGLAVLAGGAGDAGSSTWLGPALTLGGALCFAGHIAGLGEWATRANAVGLTAASVAVAALLCALVAGLGGRFEPPPDAATWRAVGYLALAATCVGFVVQAWAQSALSATTAAVVMTSEPVFAAVLAVAAGERGLGAGGWVGGLLVVGAMVVAELGPRECCDALSPRVECC